MTNRTVISHSRLPAPVAGFPVGVRAGHLLFISGRIGLEPASGFPLQGYSALGRKPAPALNLLAPDSWEEAFVAQATRMYDDLEVLLAENGARKTDLAFYSIYLRRMRDFPLLARTRAALFEGGVAPPSTASQVPGLLFPDALVYFDPVGVIPDAIGGIGKQVLRSNQVVQGPLSNYELGARAGEMSFYAGVVGAHPESGTIVQGADELNDPHWPRPAGALAERSLLEPISAQTYTIYKLMHAMLGEHGIGSEHILRHNVYLRHMAELPEVERIGRHVYPQGAPAGTVIGIESLARSDFLTEIEVITCHGSAIERAPRDPRVASWGGAADAVRGGNLIFTSGLLGYDPMHGRVVTQPADLAPQGAREVATAIGGLALVTRQQQAAAAQAWAIIEQLQIVLASLGASLGTLLKITVYLRDMAEFAFVHRVLLAALGDDPPAISVIAVADLPLRAARLQIEAVAASG